MVRAVIISVLIVLSIAGARATETVQLWPGEADAMGRGQIVKSKGDTVTRITSVTQPTLTLHQAKHTTGPTPAVLVCPGGGYKILAINIEGTEVAEWLNSIGITAAVLRYTVPANRDAAFADAQRAMRLLRANASAWNIDPEKVGIMGFSAGGHLTARISTHEGIATYSPIDDADTQSPRPDFAIVVYPAYLADKQLKLAPEITVTANTTPAFVVQTQDDKSFVHSSIAYAAAMTNVGVPVEFHLFPTGGHGYGLGKKKSEATISTWPRLCERWLLEQVIAKPNARQKTASKH